MTRRLTPGEALARLFGYRTTYLALACVLSTLAGALLGARHHFSFPVSPSLLEEAPPGMSQVLDREGSVVATLGGEKRLALGVNEIPEVFRRALIASEDARFEQHGGIDAIGVARGLVSCVQRGRCQGASTITMQLAGMLFLDRSERTFERKLREVALALELERRYTKREILAEYTNHVHFGHGLYGLEAASRFYFGRPARELTLVQAATLVGVLPAPARYSPRRDPALALRRRNLVLHRMAEVGLLPSAEADRLSRLPLVLPDAAPANAAPAGHFVERVRRQLLEQHGTRSLHEGGWVVHTTLDPRLQAIAEQVMAEGLARIEREWNDEAADGAIEGALVALDPSTGEVLALVGGADFDESPFDRATQARRQAGSLFKPFVLAGALSAGWTLGDVLVDEPLTFVDPRWPAPYQPENFEREFRGALTLRRAMAHSVNVPAVDLLRRVGVDRVLQTARALGYRSPLSPYPSLALGAFEASLLELTSAYGAFANGGLWLEPHTISRIDAADGRTAFRPSPAVREALDPARAFLVNRALASVIEEGTGRAAGRALPGLTIAGKTGTTDGCTDAWFIGYTPRLVAGVWVGRDERRSLGSGATGARVALPLWIEFVRQALDGTPDVSFPVPPGIVSVPIDPTTGLRAHAGAGCPSTVLEHYLVGTEPLASCSASHHARLAMPYRLHRFPLDASGRLSIPRSELERLLAIEPGLTFDWGREVLRAGGIELPVAWAAESLREEPSHALDSVARSSDGKPARVVRWQPD